MNLKEVEEAIGYHFNDKNLIFRARRREIVEVIVY